METYIAFEVPLGCIAPKRRVSMSDTSVWRFDGRQWMRVSPREDSLREPILAEEEVGETMECIDQEVEEGWAHFVCDVCDIAYKYTEVGFAWHQLVSFQGRYTHGLMYACKTCLEELGHDEYMHEEEQGED